MIELNLKVCREIRVELPGLAAGQLDENARAAIEQHLSFCEGCRFEWREHQLVWRCLTACEDVDPPAELHARVLKAIEGSAGAGPT